MLGLSDAIERLTAGPAQVIGLPLGQLAEGAIADVCVFDPEQPWTLDARRMSSAGKNSPFDGWEFRGQVTHTLFHGRIVHRPES